MRLRLLNGSTARTYQIGMADRRPLELVATDGVFRYGEGPEVTGRTLELVMAMAGRSAYVERLEGPGVETLKERFTRAA